LHNIKFVYQRIKILRLGKRCDTIALVMNMIEYQLKPFETVVQVKQIANIHYFEFTNRFHTKKDLHPFRELIYVDNSLIYVDAENYCGELRKNQLIIHKAGEPHALACPENDAVNIIIIGFSCDSPELDRFSYKPVTLSTDLQKVLTEVIKEGRNVFLPPYDLPNQTDMKKREDYPFGADQLIQNYLETFLIRLIREEIHTVPLTKNIQTNTKIVDVCSYIEANYKGNISLDELCFLFNTNKTTLCSQFRQAYGMTIVDYISKLKIREAKILLREGKHNITQISAQLGFSSVHYFSRLFKRYEDLSPSEYVKTIKSRLGV